MSNDTSRVLTLVFTDLADSTALKSARGDDVVDALLTRHREHVTTLAQDCSGRVIDWAGDGCFLTFETASAAVLFALRLQQAHTEENDLPGVRIGVHLGEVTERPGPDGLTQVKGLAVDVAARIQGLAKPGQVLMSASVHNSAKQRMGVEAMGMPLLWQLHGTYALKGFDTPLDIAEAGIEGVAPLEAPKVGDKARLVRKARKQPEQFEQPVSRGVPLWAVGAIVLVLLGVIGYLFAQLNQEPQSRSAGFSVAVDGITSIAVLPFDNFSGDPTKEYFVDGMTDTLTAELAKIGSIKVIARTSAMRYKNTTLTASEIASELGVEGLVEGSVQQAGDEIRITAQLIDGRSEEHIWSNNFDGTTTGILRLQGEVALAIAESIDAALSPQLREAYAEAPDVNPEAYNEYLRGIEAQNVVSRESLTRALEHFRRAQELDPDFADAWGKAGRTLQTLSAFMFQSPIDTLREAKQAGSKALELDPENVDGLVIAAYVARVEEFDIPRGNGLHARALELHPNDVSILVSEGYNQAAQGNFQRSLEFVARFLEVDPNSPATRLAAALQLSMCFEFEASQQILEELYAQDPDYPVVSRTMLRNFIHLGRLEDAIRLGDSGIERMSAPHRAWYYAFRGRHAEAEELLESLITPEASDRRYQDLAQAALELGKLDLATDLFTRSIENVEIGSINHLALGVFAPRYLAHPEWQRLTNDPRYWALLERIGFDEFPPHHPGYPVQEAYRAGLAGNEPIERIAVLPFTSIASDDSQEWFVDGMTDALITELGKIRAVKVTGRTSSMRFKNVAKLPQDIASELGVQGLIEGTVVRQDNRVRISARLIDGRNGDLLWGQDFLEEIEDILQLHGDLALAIAVEIQAAVTPEEETELRAERNLEQEAYEQFLLGRYYYDKGTSEGFSTAIEHFRRAIELRPDFADAHAFLAGTLWYPTVWAVVDTNDVMDEARAALDRALELDPMNRLAMANTGFIAFGYDYDRAGAEQVFRTLLDIDPDNTDARIGLAWCFAIEHRFDEAIAEAERSIDLDPLSFETHRTLTNMYQQQHRLKEANEANRRALELAPDHIGTLWDFVENYILLGDFDAALEYYDRLAEVENSRRIGLRAEIYAHTGHAQEARELLARIESGEAIGPVYESSVASAYSALGEVDKAFEWLEKLYQKRRWFLIEFTTAAAPLYKNLHDDPRWTDLLRRIGIDDVWDPESLP